MSGVTGDLQSATGLAAMMVGAYGMDESYFSYLMFGMQGLSAPDVKPRVEAILQTQYRQTKQLIGQNREAVIAIAEALILRSELTDIDVNAILARIEVDHPYRAIGSAAPTPTFGFGSALPGREAAPTLRRRRDSQAAAPQITIIDAQMPQTDAAQPPADPA
jgi:cell division protease FtsH